MKNRDTYGTPYTLGEARLAAADVLNPYHRELMQWLVRGVSELAAIVTDATANLELKSDRAHRLHVAKLFRDRMTAVVDADSLERALTCARCDGDGEVSHGSCGVPDCEHADPCPVCGGTGKRPTDDEIATLRLAYERAAADATVTEVELAAYKERDAGRPHPFDDGLAFVLESWCAWAREPERAAILGGPDHALLTAVARMPGRWRDVVADPIRTVAMRVLANAGADGLPPNTRRDAAAIARWVIGKTAPVTGTSK
jgi:hypothetical protein